MKIIFSFIFHQWINLRHDNSGKNLSIKVVSFNKPKQYVINSPYTPFCRQVRGQ